MRAPYSLIPAMPIALGLIAGIIVFDTYSGVITAVLAVVAFAVLIALHKHYVAYIAAAVAIGWLVAAVNRPVVPSAEIMAADEVTCFGYVTKQKDYEDARRCIIRVEAIDGKMVDAFNCATLTRTLEPVINYGDTVAFTAKLTEVGAEPVKPNAVDYSAFYKVDGVAVMADVLSEKIHVLGHGKSLMCSLRAMREDLIDAIVTSPLAPPTQALLIACVAGDDLYISEQLQSDFRVSGIAHLLALSGFHIGIIVIIFSVLLYPMRMWSHVGRWRHIIVIAAVWAYVCMLGLMPSVVRAATMMTVFLISRLVQRHRSPYNSLAVAAIAILIFKPYSLFSPGFQLSFAAVLAILLLAERLNPVSPRRHFLHSAMSLLTVSFSAMVGTVVISAYYFHTIPLLFLPVNAVMALLFPVFMIGGIVTISGVHLALLTKLVDAIYNVIDYVSSAVASLPFAAIENVNITAVEAWIIIAVILLLSRIGKR